MSTQLFGNLQVVNIGLESFVEPFEKKGIPHVHMEWRPSLEVSAAAKESILKNKTKIDLANAEAISRVQRGRPALVGMAKALEVIPGMKKNLILHAGPPVTWERMCGPMKGAVIGALIYEGMAKNEVEAENLVKAGKVEFSPCHEHQAVGPMAGIVSASMPVFIVKNEEFGNLTYSTQNEGLGKVLRYGAFSAEVIDRLKWMENTLYPTLKKAIESKKERVDLKSIILQALHMGDEVHNRNRAGTSLLYRALAPEIVTVAPDKETALAVLNFINGNDHFFLNLSMAASKAMLDPARNVEGSSLVVVMARNGTDFGVQLSGTGSAWFTGKAPLVDALYFPGFSAKDANPDIGDSAITETAGLGGFAMAAAFAIVQFVGGNADTALNYSRQMYEITLSESPQFQIPSLNFRGTPTGIDVIKVIEKNILPVINTGVAHKDPGVGQVGAGVLSAPTEPFQKAYEELAKCFK